jgi:coenzyme F420-reducing hydrogenase beta subunit
LVDHAICVAPNSDKDKLFQFKVCRTPEQVRGCAKSSYYPVELSDVLQQVATEGGRYALIGLPCCIKAVRLSMQKMPVLRRRITHLLGLVCGQQKGKFFSEYVAALKGAEPRHLITLRFREKDPGRPASDYGLHYECLNGNGQHTEDTVFWSEGMMNAWLAGYFTLNACNYCDDLFAELADAAFMDAWLPEYSGDWRGNSIVLTRNPDLQVLIEKGQDAKELVLEPLVIDKVIASQAGGLANKRTALAKRLTWAVKHKQNVPEKRVRPVPYGVVDGLSLTIEDAAMAQSKAVFLELKNKGTITTICFQKKLKMSLVKYKFLFKIFHIINGLMKRL